MLLNNESGKQATDVLKLVESLLTIFQAIDILKATINMQNENQVRYCITANHSYRSPEHRADPCRFYSQKYGTLPHLSNMTYQGGKRLVQEDSSTS
uniref:Uncharacterized protein n=1 Tax=Romanomermis culicivorax TaxID=13658 RepID=A0A915JN99_ROMCU